MATLKQIQLKLKRLQSRTGILVAERAQAVRDEIHSMMERHGLTAEDMAAHGKRRKRAARTRVTFPAPAGRRENMSRLASQGDLPAKYRNPKTGETWSGWARPPAWIAGVKDRSKFLIDAEGNENVRPKRAADLTMLEPKQGDAHSSTARTRKRATRTHS